MSFKVGDTVILIKLNRRGTIVEELSKEQYRVALGAMPVKAKASELKLAASEKSAKKTKEKGKERDESRRPAQPKAPEVLVRRKRRKEQNRNSIDLHGLRVPEALSRVEEAINQAILNDTEKLEIVHGIGTGKIKAALYEQLKGLTVVKHFKLDEANPGATWVYF